MRRLLSSITVKLTTIVVLILLLSAGASIWIVAVAAEQLPQLLPESNQMRVFTLILATVGICAILDTIFMSFASLFITKPIKKMAEMAQDIAKGEFTSRTSYKSSDEIGSLADSLNKMAQELDNMAYMRKDFISNVSHEFKTPIASIQGFAELMQEQSLSQEERSEYLGIIIDESKRLHSLSENMLRLSRLDRQVLPDKQTTFRLDEQIRRVLMLLEDSWAKKDIAFDLDLPPISYEGDEPLIQQIWMNLIANAIKFSPDSSTITILLASKAEGVEVVVADEGIGMPTSIQQRIYERFYQGETSRIDQGNGLGLAITKRILTILSGEIHFTSTVGKGTRFTVFLPYIK